MLMGVPTKQKCWPWVFCLCQVHGLDSCTSESSPFPRLHMPSHWVVRIILASLGSSIFIDQPRRGRNGLFQMAPMSILVVLVFGWDSLEKRRGRLQSCTSHSTRLPRTDAGSPIPQRRTESPDLCDMVTHMGKAAWRHEHTDERPQRADTLCIFVFSTKTAEYINTSQLRSCLVYAANQQWTNQRKQFQAVNMLPFLLPWVWGQTRPTKLILLPIPVLGKVT